jgi:hypothetical protein
MTQRLSSAFTTTVVISALLLLLLAPAPISGSQAIDDLFTDLHCNLTLYINSVVQPDQAPYDPTQDPSQLVTARETTIKIDLPDPTDASLYYIRINPTSIKAYCYNDSTPTVLQPFGPVSYIGDLIKAVTVRIGGLPACAGIPGCDGFELSTLLFYRQFPVPCTRFRIELDANIYEDADSPTAVSSSSFSSMSVAASIYSRLATNKKKNTGVSVSSVPLPENYTLLGTTDTLVFVINSTAADRALAHASDSGTTAFELGLLIPVGVLFGVLFLVAIGIAINNANKAAIAAKAASSSSNVSGHAYSDNQRLMSSDGKRMSDIEMQGGGERRRYREPRPAGSYSGY